MANFIPIGYQIVPVRREVLCTKAEIVHLVSAYPLSKYIHVRSMSLLAGIGVLVERLSENSLIEAPIDRFSGSLLFTWATYCDVQNAVPRET